MNKAKASAARASRFNSVLITSQQPSSNRISDDVLLKDIDKSVNEWTRKCGIALTLGQVNEYMAKKSQVCVDLEMNIRNISISDLNAARVATSNQS